MNKTIFTPLFILSGITLTIVLMAGTNLFNPIMKFIHNNAINPLETGACLLFTIAGFAASYFLLNLLCSYFVPRMKASKKNHNNSSKQ